VPSHCFARRCRIARLDRREDGAVLPLDHFEISALTFCLVGSDTDALAGDDEAAEIVEKGPELKVAGCRGDGTVERKVLVDRGFAAFDRRIDPGERLADFAS